jgi:hypothetical protein
MRYPVTLPPDGTPDDPLLAHGWQQTPPIVPFNRVEQWDHSGNGIVR